MIRVVKVIANSCDCSSVMSFEANILVEYAVFNITTGTYHALVDNPHSVPQEYGIATHHGLILFECIFSDDKIGPARSLEIRRINRDSASKGTSVSPEPILFEVHLSFIA